jgi:hypothetical protein
VVPQAIDSILELDLESPEVSCVFRVAQGIEQRILFCFCTNSLRISDHREREDRTIVNG